MEPWQITAFFLGWIVTVGTPLAGFAFWLGRLQAELTSKLAASATALDIARQQGHLDAVLARVSEIEKWQANTSRWKHDVVAPLMQRHEGKLEALAPTVQRHEDRIEAIRAVVDDIAADRAPLRRRATERE